MCYNIAQESLFRVKSLLSLMFSLFQIKMSDNNNSLSFPPGFGPGRDALDQGGRLHAGPGRDALDQGGRLHAGPGRDALDQGGRLLAGPGRDGPVQGRGLHPGVGPGWDGPVQGRGLHPGVGPGRDGPVQGRGLHPGVGPGRDGHVQGGGLHPGVGPGRDVHVQGGGVLHPGFGPGRDASVLGGGLHPGVGPGAPVQGGGLHPGFGPGRDAHVRGGGLHPGYGIFRDAPAQGGRGQELDFGLGRETIGGFPVGGGLQGLGELGVRGLEGGYQDAAMGQYLGGGGGVGGGLLRGADAMGGYHGFRGGFGGRGQPQLNVQQLLNEKRILETNYRLLVNENQGLCHENSQMIVRIRSQTEEGKRMRSEHEREKKENMTLREFSDKNQDDLIALRSETSRRCMEYEAEISKLKESERKWRLKVQQLKKARFSDKFDEKKELEINQKRLSIPAMKGQDDRRVFEKITETIPEKQQFKFRKVDGDRRVENLSSGTEAAKIISKPQKTKAIQLSQRQKQIKYLESRDKLSKSEVIKLDNLKQQEELWLKLEIEESIQDAKMEFHRNVSDAGIKKQAQPEVKVHGEEEVEDSLDRVSTCEEVQGLEFQREKVHREVVQGEVVQGDVIQGDVVQVEVQGGREGCQREEFLGEEIQGNEARGNVMKMCAKDPDHLKQLNNLPLRNDPIFVKVPDGIPISKNRQLSILLHSGKDAEKLVKLIKATPLEYKILTGRDLEEVVVTDGRMDSIEDLSIHTKSNSWIKQLGGVYNKITAFVEDNPEFRYDICFVNLDILTCH